MIGGHDIVLEGLVQPADIDFTIRYVVAHWKEAVAVVPSLEREDRLRDLQRIALGPGTELFVYASPQAREDWRLHGLTDQNAGELVYVAVEDDALCFTVDSATSPTAEMARNLVRDLAKNRRLLRPVFEKEAA